jgi:hypothetical protein
MAGEDSKPEKNVFRITGNTFYNQKNKIPMKILEFKRSGIRLIVGFCGIPNGIPDHELPTHARLSNHMMKHFEELNYDGTMNQIHFLSFSTDVSFN